MTNSYSTLQATSGTTMSVIRLNNQTFYPYLVHKDKRPTNLCLLSSNIYLSTGFLVAKDHLYPNKPKSSKIYTCFNTYLEFYLWMRNLPFNERNFYEIIHMGPQKPHFDIDIDVFDKDGKIKSRGVTLNNFMEIGTATRNNLLAACIELFREYGLSLSYSGFLVFDSSSNNKYSCHVVIDGYFHQNGKDAKEFYNLVVSRLDKSFQSYVDSAVYGKNQQFRLLGNNKINKNNVKGVDAVTTWQPSEDCSDENIFQLRLFEASLVTFTSGCVALPFSPEVKRVVPSGVDASAYYSDIMAAFEASEFCHDFTPCGCTNNILSLKRKHKSYCPICDRVHDNENAYIKVYNSGSICYKCRRDDLNRSFNIGVVGVAPTTDPDLLDGDEVVGDDNINNIGGVDLRTGRIQAQPIINLNVQATPIVKITPQYTNRAATTDDILYFVTSLRVEDSTSTATCPDLYNEFTTYCGRCNLTCSIGARAFTNFITKSASFVPQREPNSIYPEYVPVNNTIITTKDWQNRTVVVNVSISKAPEIFRQNPINQSSLQVGPTNVSSVIHSSADQYINTNEKITLLTSAQATTSDKIKFQFCEAMLRDFWDDEMVPIENERVNVKDVYKSFKFWTEERGIVSTHKARGLSRLIKSRFGLERISSNGEYYFAAWNVRRNISAGEHQQKEDSLRRIWTFNNKKYTIGCHNGLVSYNMSRTPRWNGINIRRVHETRTENGRIKLPSLEEMLLGSEIRCGMLYDFVLAIRADLSSGKTESIKKYIEEHPDMRVLIVLPNIALTNKFIQELGPLGFVIYSDDTVNKKTVIEGNRICTTYNSMFKCIGDFDLLIIDEYRLVHKMQFNKILTTKHQSYRAFNHRLRTTPRVVIADGLLENKHVLQMKDITQRTVNVYQCMNNFRDDDEVIVIDNDIHAMNQAIKHARQGLRVAVASGSCGHCVFIKNKLQELAPDMNIGLYTRDEMKGIKVDPTTLWNEHQVIVYSPTILAGSSYLGRIDCSYGIFLTGTCGPDASVQMLYRCRNNNKFYICVKNTNKKRIIGEGLYPSYSNTLMWLSNKDRLYNSVSAGEEDIIHAGLVYSTGTVDDNYLQLYASYVQDEEKARTQYLFHMLLYMRDMGVKFGGLDSTLNMSHEDQEQVNIVKREFFEFRKDINDKVWTAKAAVPEIPYHEYLTLDRKTNKTKEERYKINKYKVMKRYDIPNEQITADIMKQASGNNVKHDNITLFGELSGVPPDKLQDRMKDIYLTNLPGKLKDIHPDYMFEKIERNRAAVVDFIRKNTIGPDTINREYLNMTETSYKDNFFKCMHGVNMLNVLGFNNFKVIYERLFPTAIDPNLSKPYIDANWDELHVIAKLQKIKPEDYVNKVTKTILEEAFGMSYNVNKDGACSLGRGTFKLTGDNFTLSKLPDVMVNAPQPRALVLNVVAHKTNVVNTVPVMDILKTIAAKDNMKGREIPTDIHDRIARSKLTIDTTKFSMPRIQVNTNSITKPIPTRINCPVGYNPMVDGPLIRLPINKSRSLIQ